jgi:hypothetical protein
MNDVGPAETQRIAIELDRLDQEVRVIQHVLEGGVRNLEFMVVLRQTGRMRYRLRK